MADLVAHKEHRQMLARERRHVPGPSLNGGKGSFAGDVVHKDNTLWGEGRGEKG